MQNVFTLEEKILSPKTTDVRLKGERQTEHTVFVRCTGSGSITIEAEEGSKLTVVCLVDSSVQGPLKIEQRVRVEGSAYVHMHNITLANAEHSLVSELHGADATSTVDWIFYAKGAMRQVVSAKNVFMGRSGRGEITMKGVAEDRGHVRCDGMIEIGEGGTGTDTYLTEEVLMLDPTAKIDAIPGLEIRTNDVKASHSATVARVTPEDLFYFQSRGIPKKLARKLYIQGFLGDLTEKIADPDIRLEVLRAIEKAYG